MTDFALYATAVVLLVGLIAFRFSTAYEVLTHFHALDDLKPDGMGLYLSLLLSRARTPRGRRVLRAIVRKLASASDSSRRQLAEVVRMTAPLFGKLSNREIQLDEDGRQHVADSLDEIVAGLEKLAELEHEGLSFLAARLVRQDRLFADILRSSSPAHLRVLRDQTATLVTDAEESPHNAAFLHSEILRSLHEIFEGLDQIDFLPRSTDRFLVLNEALNRTLVLHRKMGEQSLAEPTFGLLLGSVAVEVMQKIFNDSLKKLRESAEIELRLRSRRLAVRHEAVLTVDIVNIGHIPAQNLTVELLSDDERLHIIEGRRALKLLARNRTQRVEFRVEPECSEQFRLSFRVKWDRMRPGDDIDHNYHERRYSELVEMRRIEIPETFRVLSPNPYVVGRPLGPEDPFYGRDELFERLRTSFQGAEQDNIVVLIGLRRMGKTSVLRRLHEHLPEAYVPILVDLQALGPGGEVEFFRDIASQICEELEERGVTLMEPPAESFEEEPGQFFRRSFLREVKWVLGNRRALLIFDEMEVLEERMSAGQLPRQILAYMRSLMQHEDGISFMLVGTHRLDELTADYWGVLFNLAVYLDVGHLADEDIRALMTEPVHGFFEVDSLAQDKVLMMTGGHPLLSQFLARELVELGNREKQAYMSVGDVNRVIEAVVEKGELHVSYLWEGAGHDERLVMLATLELLKKDGVASLLAVHRYLNDRGARSGDLPEALRRLKRKEILVEDEGQLRFRVDLLRLWLKREVRLEDFLHSTVPDQPLVFPDSKPSINK